ncbi:hypothetical protein CFP56_019356 [Quercus suber]|uniref:Uncharacterized protein n=1 Tax=Quercus suber TaxID=58331 RepID=A0AAW0KJT5_QUESU
MAVGAFTSCKPVAVRVEDRSTSASKLIRLWKSHLVKMHFSKRNWYGLKQLFPTSPYFGCEGQVALPRKACKMGYNGAHEKM